MVTTSDLKSYSFILSIVILQITVYFVVYTNMPIARMAVCFLYLLFIPGVVIVKLLALKTLDISEKILFSTSLSIAFLMLVGVALNEIGALFIANPLSLNILILSINSILLVAAFMGNRRAELGSAQFPRSKLSSYLLLALLYISLLLLGSYGIFIVNYSSSNFIILILIVLISSIVPITLLKEKANFSNLYAFLLLVIFVCSLLFISTSYSLITRYITGVGDQWLEYYVFRLTGNFWNSQLQFITPFYSMISVTILPQIFLSFTAMDQSFLFKLLYPIVAAFVAIGAYKLYQTQTDNKTAFLATFFLITVSVGKGMGPARQQIAELFYILLFLVLLKKSISPLKKNILLIIFGIALVFSHYSLTYIFLLTLIVSYIIYVFSNYMKTGRIKISQVKIPLVFVLIFSTIAFSWYIYVNGSAAFTPLIQTIDTVVSNLNQFFNPASRGTALAGLGIVEAPSIYYRISSVLFILTEILLVLGFLTIVIRRKNSHSNFSFEYKIFAALNLAIIATNLLLPRIADTFLMERFYQITLIILAPLAVVGGKAILEFMFKSRHQKYYIFVLALLIFTPLFMFQTNFVYEVTGDRSYNLTLSKYRWDSSQLYSNIATTQEVAGAQWIEQNARYFENNVYSDFTSLSNVLTAYALTRGHYIYDLMGTTEASNALIYISDGNLIREGYVLNATIVSEILQDQNTIYSNGQCGIFEVP